MAHRRKKSQHFEIIAVVVIVGIIMSGMTFDPPPDPWTLEAAPFGTLVYTDGPYSGQLADILVHCSTVGCSPGVGGWVVTECGDGIDNDGDGLIDENDPSCVYLTDGSLNGLSPPLPDLICDGRLVLAHYAGSTWYGQPISESNSNYFVGAFPICSGWSNQA